MCRRFKTSPGIAHWPIFSPGSFFTTMANNEVPTRPDHGFGRRALVQDGEHGITSCLGYFCVGEICRCGFGASVVCREGLAGLPAASSTADHTSDLLGSDLYLTPRKSSIRSNREESLSARRDWRQAIGLPDFFPPTKTMAPVGTVRA